MSTREKLIFLIDRLSDDEVVLLLKIAEWISKAYLSEEERTLLKSSGNLENALWHLAQWRGKPTKEG